jgi:hypothetical protein
VSIWRFSPGYLIGKTWFLLPGKRTTFPLDKTFSFKFRWKKQYKILHNYYLTELEMSYTQKL